MPSKIQTQEISLSVENMVQCWLMCSSALQVYTYDASAVGNEAAAAATATATLPTRVGEALRRTRLPSAGLIPDLGVLERGGVDDGTGTTAAAAEAATTAL